MSERPKLTLAQIVEQFEISRATLRRGIESGRFPHAKKDPQGRWVVPVDDLIAAQVKGRKTWLNEGAHEGGHPAHDEHAQGAHIPSDPSVSAVASELAQLKNELAHERAQKEAAQQLADERGKHIETLNTALKMIEAAPGKAPRRRWWQRRL